ncbi:MAG: hypothetical protein JXD22_01085 [Sedimentisphaerales bacterium]|nr:hypothetical protein [Sedimentisphaerales bacterium]
MSLCQGPLRGIKRIPAFTLWAQKENPGADALGSVARGSLPAVWGGLTGALG